MVKMTYFPEGCIVATHLNQNNVKNNLYQTLKTLYIKQGGTYVSKYKEEPLLYRILTLSLLRYTINSQQ